MELEISGERGKILMKKCELLVPAGGEKQFIAAVENGADAIYIGGKRFNARINAVNFSDDEIREAVHFAHKRGVKVYVTMNTLLKDDEMEDAVKYAAFLYETGVDALIIQDVGLGMLLRENLPGFPLHLSTQGSVYDARGAETAYRMGYERVVLARELSMEEIMEVCKNTTAEIEVFVHGALCICYSGQCQMSRIFGGRSGNRGECAQPCRLPYKTFEGQGKLTESFKHPLSPKDLCMIDHIGELADAGVASLKIEGRMKSPEYVAIVTSIYRKYLDMYYEKGGYTVSEEDRKALEQIFNRGGFTEGYYEGNPEENLMAGNIPKHRGIRIGKVIKKIQGTSLIDVKLYDELSIGDGVEIQGRNVTGNVVTYYKELKSGLTRIGDIKGEVSHGDVLYRITRKSQLEEARKTFENKTYEEGKYIRKTPVNMNLFCTEEGRIVLNVKSHELNAEADVTGEIFPYEKGVVTEGTRISKALAKTGNTPFTAVIDSAEDIYNRNIPISAINKIRREGIKALEEKLEKGREPETLMNLPYAEVKNKECRLEFVFYTWDDFESFVMPSGFADIDADKIALIPLVEYERHYNEIDKERAVIPYITNISKGKENDFIEENFEKIVSHVKDTGIYVGNLSWILPFRTAVVPVYGDSGLNVYNRYAEEAYAEVGVKECALSLEAAEEGMGNMALMISEHVPEGDWLLDRKKKRADILKRDYSNQVIIKRSGETFDIYRIKELVEKKKGIIRIFI